MTRRNSSVERRCAPASIRSLALVTAGSLTRSGRPTACSPAIQILLARYWPRWHGTLQLKAVVLEPGGMIEPGRGVEAPGCLFCAQIVKAFHFPTASVWARVSRRRKACDCAWLPCWKSFDSRSSTCRRYRRSSSAGSLSTSWRGRRLLLRGAQTAACRLRHVSDNARAGRLVVQCGYRKTRLSGLRAMATPLVGS